MTTHSSILAWGQRSLVGCIVHQFSSVRSLSRVQLFVTPWTAAHQASLSITNTRSLVKLMFIKSVMPSNHPIFCRPLLLLPSIFPSIRVFPNESVLHIRWQSIGVSASASVLPVNAEFHRIVRRDKKAFLSDQCKEKEKNNRIRKTRDLFKKTGYQGNVSYKDGHDKGQKWYGLKRSKNILKRGGKNTRTI